jgi:hypothetical protein
LTHIEGIYPWQLTPPLYLPENFPTVNSVRVQPQLQKEGAARELGLKNKDLHLSQKLYWQQGIITASLKMFLHRGHLSSGGGSIRIGLIASNASASLAKTVLFINKDGNKLEQGDCWCHR